jgi:hypothetical protein
MPKLSFRPVEQQGWGTREPPLPPPRGWDMDVFDFARRVFAATARSIFLSDGCDICIVFSNSYARLPDDFRSIHLISLGNRGRVFDCMGFAGGRRRSVRQSGTHDSLLLNGKSLPQRQAFLFFHLSPEYQIERLNGPNLLRCFGVEVLFYQASLLWCGGQTLDNFWGDGERGQDSVQRSAHSVQKTGESASEGFGSQRKQG